MKRAVFVAAAAVCAACGGTAASPSNAGSGSTPSVPTPAATSAKLKVHVSGAGRVVSAPAGLDCRDDCGATFASSAMVVLTAMADADHAFSGFGGACSGMVCVLTLSGDTQVSATFTPNPAPPRVFTVTVDVSGSGIGRVESSPAGLDCKTGKCTASFVEGT